MARDILGEYGPESKSGSRASCGGYTMKDKVDVNNYATPTGPKGQMHQGPGLGGTNYGNCGTQGMKSGPSGESGRPGLGGANRGYGSQGKR